MDFLDYGIEMSCPEGVRSPGGVYEVNAKIMDVPFTALVTTVRRAGRLVGKVNILGVDTRDEYEKLSGAKSNTSDPERTPVMIALEDDICIFTEQPRAPGEDFDMMIDYQGERMTFPSMVISCKHEGNNYRLNMEPYEYGAKRSLLVYLYSEGAGPPGPGGLHEL